MPFVSAAEAPNAHLVEVPFDGPIPADGVHRLPLVGTPSMRHVLLEFPPGFATTPHRHPGAGESFLILGGSGWFTIDGERYEALPGRLLWAPTDEVHAIEAGPDGLRFMASVGPNEDRPDEEILVTEGTGGSAG
jgi:quercetin dioxygenase-like cupin family protein